MDTDKGTFAFLLAWIVWLALLSFFNSTKLGHVILYYSLVLMIVYVLVTQYKNLSPILTSVTNIGNAGKGQ